MRTPMIVGNWKMNTTVDEAVNLVQALRTEINDIQRVEKVVCPPFISLVAVRDILRSTQIKVGAQNLYFAEKGAYTGEISPLMLVGLCEFVILGHSERRQYFQETDEMISKKVNVAVKTGLKPILCIGENLGQYESNQTQEVVTRQLISSLAGVTQIETLTVAYEPVWAIGTGMAATGQQADKTISLIRSLIAQKYSSALADRLRILYGGSVTAANIAEFVSQPDIDGALVGGASLKAGEFAGIVKITAETRPGA
jgi:triosephosphate isomerase (TIM)